MSIEKLRAGFRIVIVALGLLHCLILLNGCTSPAAQQKSPGEDSQLVVLNYHNIGNYDDFYSVSTGQFVQQVEYMLSRGYSVIGLEELRSWHNGIMKLPAKVFMLTFDDGNLSDFEVVFPLLKQHKLKGVFFLDTDRINKEGHLDSNQIKEMSSSGLCEFGSHSVNHKNLITISQGDMDEELAESKNYIHSITGQETFAFSYPNGFWNESVKKRLGKNGYSFAFTVMPGVNRATTDQFELRRISLSRNTSPEIFASWVELKAELYEKYYTDLLAKARKDGLTTVVRICQEELNNL